jgi:hypothetical protein
VERLSSLRKRRKEKNRKLPGNVSFA